ncbi:MAG: SHOCT domain-containing protein, partial [Porcipelethomonas sp.]
LTNLGILWYALAAGFLCLGFAMNKIKVKTNDDDSLLVLGLILSVIVFGIPVIIRCIVNNIAKQCSLSLTEKSITGNRKTLFAYSEIKLPIDKVDSIMASHSFLNILTGGDTLLIRSASGAVKFLWVQNAKEFVDATLAKIEEFKQSVKDENQNLVSAVAKSVGANSGNSSAAQKIKEIKELLDSGLITQEEFEAKRKELLDKM